MSRWNHVICEDCWDDENPDRPASRVVSLKINACCFCETETRAGIFFRADPAGVQCGGDGGTHDEEE